MKKWAGWALFLLSVALFLTLRARADRQQPLSLEHHKPTLPAPHMCRGPSISNHPWLQIQPAARSSVLEIGRDLGKIGEIAQSIPRLSEEELTQLLMNKLLSMQEQIPFIFPEELYNVLWIPKSDVAEPSPYQILKRLYLGETELGLPFYLDVRLFDLNRATRDDLVSWHLELLKGTQQLLRQSENRSTYLCRGIRNPVRADTTHGFAALQGERALYLDFFEQGSQLFVCYAEAPLKIFQIYEPLLRAINTR